MRKKALFPVLFFAVIAFSAPRGAAAFDFSKSSEPLGLSEVSAVPAAPAPAAAAPKVCKPFLLEISVGGVEEKVILERACTPENDPVWAIMLERATAARLSVKVSSDQYPAERARLESRIKSMAIEGVKQEEADFIVMKTGAALKEAETAPTPRERLRVLAKATEDLKIFLARP